MIRPVLPTGAFLLACAIPTIVHGQVVAYEGNSFPDEAAIGYVYDPLYEPVRWIENGVLVGVVEPLEDMTFGGDFHNYERSLADLSGLDPFFVEARLMSDGPSEDLSGTAPSWLILAGLFGVGYHMDIADDQIEFFQDAFVEYELFDIQPALFHTIRLELDSDVVYAIFIDGQVAFTGTPSAPYPTNEFDVFTFGNAAWEFGNTTWFDYVRLGQVPIAASGDYDSSGSVGLADWYFVQDCLTKDGIGIYGGPSAPCPEDDETCQAIGETTTAGPGCTFADFDADNDVDLRDVADFVAALNPTP